MLQAMLSKPISKRISFLLGSFFLFLYWLIGFDGITFSDDVYYLLAGKDFWDGSMEVNGYHFSSRWGAYVPAGLMAWIFGFDPHKISLISWISYMGTLALLLKALPKNSNPGILLLFFCTQVYLLHFLTKVYPDSLLVFWTILIPFSAIYRKEKPILAALGVISGLFFGFITKETIVLLAPLPVLLFFWDRKRENLNSAFYWAILGFGVLFGAGYLGYFWMQFGDPFYRVSSINAGHYVSEFTYADKGIWSILRRISYLPVLTFIERAYWIWVVLAIPGFYKVWKNKDSEGMEMALAAVCLILGFWFMTSTLEFYNPIYLNPRHLIILVPIFSYLIALGWKEWQQKPKLKKGMQFMLLLGVLVSGIQGDLKMAGFHLAFLAWFSLPFLNRNGIALPALLLAPAIASIFYQHRIKDYSNFKESLLKESTTDSTPILVNNFVHFSREVLLPTDINGQSLLLPIEKLDSLAPSLGDSFRVFLYDYYRHAYPKEEEDVLKLESWLLEEAELVSEEKTGKVWIRKFQKR